MFNKVIKVSSWLEFKRLIVENTPQSIAYNIEQGVPARHLTSLRLILLTPGTQYVFLDYRSGNCLKKTGIPLHRDRFGNLYIEDEDIKEFVRSETGIKNLKLYSYWTI